jgi:hypothetical protein
MVQTLATPAPAPDQAPEHVRNSQIGDPRPRVSSMSASEGAAHVDEKAREDSFERHRSGKRLMRRRQVEVIGNARHSRKLGGRMEE